MKRSFFLILIASEIFLLHSQNRMSIICNPYNGVSVEVGTNCYVISVEYPEIYSQFTIDQKIIYDPELSNNRIYEFVNFGFSPISSNPFKYRQWTGGPAIPFLSLNLQIPDSAIVNAQIDSIDYLNDCELKYDYLPFQNSVDSTIFYPSIDYNESYYFSPSAITYLQTPASKSQIYTYRGTSGINVQLKPFLYYPNTKRIRPIRKIRYIVCVSGSETLLDMYEHTISTTKMTDAVNFYNTYCGDTLLSPPYKGHYLIITTPEYKTEAVIYKQHKINLGYDADTLIFNPTLYPIIYSLPAVLRSMIKLKYIQKGCLPRYILIIGSAKVIPYSEGDTLADSKYKNDIFYACLDHSNISDELVLTPESFVGRWPINSHEELQNIMTKSIYYDFNTPPNRKIALFSGILDDGVIKFADANMFVYDLIQNYVTNDYCTHYNGANGLTSNDMYSTIYNNSFLMMIYRGHGSISAFGPPFSGIDSTYIPYNLPYFTYSFACSMGGPGSIGEVWVNNGNRSCTFFGATIPTYRGNNNEFEKSILNGLRDCKNYTIGELTYKGISEYFLGGGQRNEIRSYILHGDPSLYIYGTELLGNPAQYINKNDEFTEYKIHGNEQFHYYVFSPLGIIISSNVSNDINDVEKSLSNLSNGIYIVVVLNKDNQLIFSKKVLINDPK